MRRAIWLLTLLFVVAVSLAADRPDRARKAAAKDKEKAKAATRAPAPAERPKAGPGSASPDPRASSLFRSAQNLETVGKKPGAIGLYRDLLIRYPASPEASQATARIKALGGKLPDPSEIKPAPPPEEAKFTRAPKPKYASQAANRAAVNEMLGGAVGGAMSPPAGGGGGYGGRAPYAP
jgi:hypothetical protein